MSDHPTPAAPKELTPEAKQEWAERSFKIESRIKAGLRAGREALWDMAAALYEFEQDAGWLALDYENKSAWLADPEISMTDRTFRRLVRAHRELVVVRKIDRPTLAALDMSKVDIVLPSIESGKVILKEALSDVETLGARDLREQYYGTDESKSEPEPEDNVVGEQDDAPVIVDEMDVIESEAADITITQEHEGQSGALDRALSDIDQALASGAANPRIARESLSLLAGPWLDTGPGIERAEAGEGDLTVVVFDGLTVRAIGGQLSMEQALSFTRSLFGGNNGDGTSDGGPV